MCFLVFFIVTFFRGFLLRLRDPGHMYTSFLWVQCSELASVRSQHEVKVFDKLDLYFLYLAAKRFL